MVTKPNLTYKKKNFAKALVKHNGNGTQAALDTYDATYDSAQVIASRNMNDPVVIEEINRILEKKGLTDNYIADKMTQALEAGIEKKATNADAIKILDMLLKVKNRYPASKRMNVNMNLQENSSSKNINELKENLKKLQDTTSALLKEFQS